MGLNALTQNERLGLAFFDRVYLVHLGLPSKTLYISDRNYRYDYGTGAQDYENYLFELSHLDVELARIRANRNHAVTLKFRNDRALSSSYLIEENATYRVCFSSVHIYELRLVERGETFASDVKTLVFRGVCGQPYDITRREFKVDVHNVMLAKRGRLPLKVVDTDVDANADPDDVGKYRNTVIGTVEHVVCRCVKAGAKDTLAADLTQTGTTITLSGGTKIAFSASGTVQIDDEKITYTGFSSNELTGCTRGTDSTAEVEHDAGAAVYEVLSSYVWEAACHPVKSIDAVYVDGVRQTAGFTAYTGETGDELSGYAGRAVIEFTVLPVIKRQVNLDVLDGLGLDTGSHLHGGSSSNVTDGSGSNESSSGHVDDVTNAVDENTGTYTQIGDHDAAETGSAVYRFSNTNLGTITSCVVRVHYAYGYTSIFGTPLARVKINSESYQNMPSHTSPATESFTFSGAWTADVTIESPTTGAGVQTCKVYEILDVTWYYTSSPTGSSPATGAALTGSVTLTGNSSADTVIGGVVSADVDGQPDDGSGTYSGTPSALIERPDHVFKHLLVGLLGENAGDIGTSFATSGTSYGSTYKFGFVLHEVATEADALLQALAFQCRSKFAEWHGKFELVYQGAAPAVALTCTDDDALEEPVFGFTPEVDIKNRVYAHYSQDYRKGPGADGCDGVEAASDSTSITNNGERVERVVLSACRSQAMAADWVAWYLTQRKQEWRTLELTVPWIGKRLGAGDTFSLTWDFWTGITWDLTDVEVEYARERVKLIGQEWPS